MSVIGRGQHHCKTTVTPRQHHCNTNVTPQEEGHVEIDESEQEDLNRIKLQSISQYYDQLLTDQLQVHFLFSIYDCRIFLLFPLFYIHFHLFAPSYLCINSTTLTAAITITLIKIATLGAV
jgi:hypothetical protein